MDLTQEPQAEEEQIDEATFIEYYLLVYPQYYGNHQYLDRLATVSPDVRVKFASILKGRENPRGELYSGDHVYRIDAAGNVLEKRLKRRYICIVTFGDEGLARAWTMFEGAQYAGTIHEAGSDRSLIMLPAALEKHLRTVLPDAVFLTREAMLEVQGPCVRCKALGDTLSNDICRKCEDELEAMTSDDWNDDTWAMFKEFTIPKFKRGEI